MKSQIYKYFSILSITIIVSCVLSWHAWFSPAVQAEQEGERRKERELPDTAGRPRIAETAESQPTRSYQVSLKQEMNFRVNLCLIIWIRLSKACALRLPSRQPRRFGHPLSAKKDVTLTKPREKKAQNQKCVFMTNYILLGHIMNMISLANLESVYITVRALLIPKNQLPVTLAKS